MILETEVSKKSQKLQKLQKLQVGVRFLVI